MLESLAWFPCCYRAGRELKTNSSQLLGEVSKTETLSDLLKRYSYSEVVLGLGSCVLALWHRRLNREKWPVWRIKTIYIDSFYDGSA